jgi:hypothetical protein
MALGPSLMLVVISPIALIKRGCRRRGLRPPARSRPLPSNDHFSPPAMRSTLSARPSRPVSAAPLILAAPSRPPVLARAHRATLEIRHNCQQLREQGDPISWNARRLTPQLLAVFSSRHDLSYRDAAFAVPRRSSGMVPATAMLHRPVSPGPDTPARHPAPRAHQVTRPPLLTAKSLPTGHRRGPSRRGVREKSPAGPEQQS